MGNKGVFKGQVRGGQKIVYTWYMHVHGISHLDNSHKNTIIKPNGQNMTLQFNDSSAVF